MASVAVVIVVVAFLNIPIVYIQIKPLPPTKGVGSISDIGADSPKPVPKSPEQAARDRASLSPMCRKTVRADSERRALALKSERISALCDCSAERVMFVRDLDDKRLEGLRVITFPPLAQERAELDNGTYLNLLATAERACSRR